MTRIAFLGPAGTYTDDALRRAVGDAEFEPLHRPTVYDAIRAVAEEQADRAFVPFENSIEGAVRPTLDALAFDAPEVTIAGEHDQPITHSLIAREGTAAERIEVVLSHPQAIAQCARFIRESLPRAEPRATSSTAEAVRVVSESPRPWAAIGGAGAIRLYGGVVLRERIEDEEENVTRFVWVAPRGTRPGGDGTWRTTLIFSELGEDHPGVLVEALTEFADRGVNLTRIESRPRRSGLGRYMFFVDLDGAAEEPPVAGAIDALRQKAESVRVLGSYPVGATGIPGL
jgi:prephenate dehydratase